MTRNHNYNTPAEGTTDWHLPLNENFEFLDRDVPVRDREDQLEQYTPTENAKFEATDTGRRFIGDGTDWQEVPYPVDIGETNTVATVPNGTTLADIDDTVAASTYVRLEPGTVYSGSSTITIDPRDRDVLVDARGATVKYEGSGVCVRVTQNYGADEPYTGRVQWVGGSVDGPGIGTGTGFQVVDSYGHDFSPERVRFWQNAFELRNEGNWSEGNAIHDILQLSDSTRGVKFTGADDVGGSGTGSFRFTRIYNIMGEIRDGPFIEMTPNTSAYYSVIRDITLFIAGADAVGIHAAGGLTGTIITDITTEPGEADGGVILEFDSANTEGNLSEISNLRALGATDALGEQAVNQHGKIINGRLVIDPAGFPIEGVSEIVFADGTRFGPDDI